MTRQEAEARRELFQRDDHEHTYLVREQPPGQWEVVQIDLQRPSANTVAERGEAADVRDDPRPFISRLIPPYGPPSG
jgi:hypothetical protein